jgi:glycosyltransferase involved in cell wall biosynthesis
VVPVYNESGNLEWLNSKFMDLIDSNKIKAEIIYIDDGSRDDSLEKIKQLAGKDERVRFLGLSRNFGKEAATTAGLEAASGDVAVIIDADGQHPVEVIKSFLQEWSNGYEVVIGVRVENTGEGFLKRYGSKLFNALLNSLSGGNTVPGSTDFRLIDRRVIDEFNQLTERNRITRGLIDWLGFKRTYVEFKSPARHSGKASYGFRKLVRLALHAFISQTTKPLQLTGFLGALVTFVSAFMGIFLIFEKYVFNDPLDLAVTGTAILALFLSFLVGLVLICQWLLALYIESIHNETQNRPLYIVSDKSE